MFDTARRMPDWRRVFAALWPRRRRSADSGLRRRTTNWSWATRRALYRWRNSAPTTLTSSAASAVTSASRPICSSISTPWTLSSGTPSRHLHDRIFPSAVSISTQRTLSFGTPSRHLHSPRLQKHIFTVDTLFWNTVTSPTAIWSRPPATRTHIHGGHSVLEHRHVTYCYMITAPGYKNTYSRWTLCFGTPSRHLLLYDHGPRLQKHIFTVDTLFWNTVTSPTLL